MIAGTHRFHGRNSLRYVYQQGKTVRAGELALRFAYNNRITSYRVAVVVSRKVSKSAVIRNRIRRRIYEIVRSAAADITDPYDLIFTVYDEALAEKPHVLLRKNIVGCLARAGVLKSPSDRGSHAIIEQKETKK
ncbi:MAG TPA: ribonuclease P protein component [Candidatus Saccharimonadales bacterium]|nr:ribonuclease P protein component [Candidatus Saccharimonadales bacterium]